MEKIADKVDCKDTAIEGSSALSEAYKKLRRPYMRDFAISSLITYQSLLMSKQKLTLVKQIQHIMKT